MCYYCGSCAWRILCYMVGGAQTAYPIPRIDNTLDTLSGSCWFSTLDIVSGYWQVEVGEQDREKTAFCTPYGLYEFNVMPFGLCNGPAILFRG